MNKKYISIKSYIIIAATLSLIISHRAASQNIGINTSGTPANSLHMLEILQISTTANTVGLYAAHSGALAGGNTGYALKAIKTGATGINVAGYFSATGGGSNYAIIVPSASGNIGFGTITPASLLHVAGNTQLGTASSLTGQLKFYHASSTHATTLQAGNATAAVTYSLPTADGSSGQALLTNGSGSLSWGTPSTTSTTAISIVEDFVSGNMSNSGPPYPLYGGAGFISRMVPSGGYIPGFGTSTADHPGTFRLRNSGVNGHTLDLSNFVSGTKAFTFQACIQETTASTGSGTGGEFNRRVGLIKQNVGTEPTDGIYFRTLANGNWYAVTRSASTETATDCAVTPAAASWRTLKIVSTGTSVTFYINSVLVATHTTNIPLASAFITPGFVVYGGASATGGGEMLVDYVTFDLTGLSR